MKFLFLTFFLTLCAYIFSAATTEVKKNFHYPVTSIVKEEKLLESPVTCFSNNTACDNTEENLLDSLNGVGSVEECRQLCYDNQDCGFITYYGQDSFPYRELCFLFRSCEETHSCSGCVSETRDCYKSCGVHVVGIIGDNFLDVVSEVSSEENCQAHCVANSECNFYTFFLETDPNAGSCILLTSLIEPVLPCNSCLTGPTDCSSSQEDCHFESGNNGVGFISPGSEIIPLLFRKCLLRVLAVGGGGKGDENGGNGGGSGYIVYHTMEITASPTNITATVGDSREPSIVKIDNVLDNIVLEARAGGDGLSFPDDGVGPVGGDGYSGGGGYCVCAGGSNGAGGEGSGGVPGGQGTGEDISLFKFEYYDLSPGAGGQGHSVGDDHGGGGGGVLVDGMGPDCQGTETYCRQHIGKGFGGGGCHFYDNDEGFSNVEGAHGVILLEIVNV